MRDQQTFVANIAATYQGRGAGGVEAARGRGIAEGLKDILDSSPVLKSFVMTSKYGPLVLDRIITDPDSLKRLMGPFSSPMEMQLRTLEIAREAKAARRRTPGDPAAAAQGHHAHGQAWERAAIPGRAWRRVRQRRRPHQVHASGRAAKNPPH